MEQDWRDFAINAQGYREEEMPEPCKSFIYGWSMARKPLKERCDYAAQIHDELIMALSLEGVDYERIIEKWRDE